MPGSPIRTPWDHSLVDSSPRPIAASHVLHRLLVPRHPPFALDNLTTENKDARVHCAILNQRPTHNHHAPHQTPPQVTGMKGQVMPGIEDQPRGSPHNGCSFRYPTGCYVLTLSPAASPTTFHTNPRKGRLYSSEEPLPVRTGQCLRLRAPHHHTRVMRATDPLSRVSCSLERR